MVRFVVTIKLKQGAKEELAERGIDLSTTWGELSRIDSPGLLDFHAGFDLELHYSDNWSFAVVIDFEDYGSFDKWFSHPDHRRLGSPYEPFIDETSRVVFAMGQQL